MYEYVAVTIRDIEHRAVRAMLIKQGWEEHLRAPWHGGRGSGKDICIMRRPKEEPQDEPRKWTKAELQKLIRDERAFDVLMGDPT